MSIFNIYAAACIHHNQMVQCVIKPFGIPWDPHVMNQTVYAYHMGCRGDEQRTLQYLLRLGEYLKGLPVGDIAMSHPHSPQGICVGYA